jgi:hypothetical protein
MQNLKCINFSADQLISFESRKVGEPHTADAKTRMVQNGRQRGKWFSNNNNNNNSLKSSLILCNVYCAGLETSLQIQSCFPLLHNIHLVMLAGKSSTCDYTELLANNPCLYSQ